MREKLEVLLSCMHQTDDSILRRARLEDAAVLMVNQCDGAEDRMERWDGRHRCLFTNTRGLSVSRNLALEHADAEICLVADDDEVFYPDLEERILRAYAELPEADLIIFRASGKRLGTERRRLGKLDLLRVMSVQITFRLDAVRGSVAFDPRLGAGTGNGSGEETKFLLDCYRKGLRIWFEPVEIFQELDESDSSWFAGFDADYFYKRGTVTRYIMGLPLSLLYGAYFLVSHRNHYRNNISAAGAAAHLLRGIARNELAGKEESTNG